MDDNIERVSFTSTVSSSLRSISGSVLQYSYVSVSYSSYEITHFEQVVKFDWTAALATIGGGMALVRLFLFCLLPQHVSHGKDEEELSFGHSSSSSPSKLKDEEDGKFSFDSSSSLSSNTLNISLVPQTSLSEQ